VRIGSGTVGRFFCSDFRGRTQVQTGVNDGKWIEVQKKVLNGEPVDFDGSEEIIISNLGELTNGKPVQVSLPETQ
jgi:hypothetical protein